MKAISKLWQRWQRWQRFWEPINEIPPIIRLLLGVLVVATVAVMVSNSLQQLLNEKYDVLKVIGYCVAGVVSIWLAWAANKRANAIDATAKEQAKATENTEAGQRQERLKNAIEHLGHGSDSVRMGGAYELFHLAEDTEKLRQTVLNILCAHIRQTTGENDYQKKHKTKPSEEIQGLLTLLFVQKHDVFENCSINLQGSYLNGANLFQARLKKANLRQAWLQKKANLTGAQLQGADLREAQLQGAHLSGAQLQGAKLEKARLQGADLIITGLQGADLSGVQLQAANLMAAQLQGAHLSGAQLQGANLGKARLQGISGQAYSPLSYLLSAGFENKIRDRIDKPSDLTGITFTGGLKEEDLDTLCEGLSDDQAQALREKLRSHVGQPASHELSSDRDAVIGTYTQEEAEQWIAEYNKAMEKVPRTGDRTNAASAPDSDKDKED